MQIRARRSGRGLAGGLAGAVSLLVLAAACGLPAEPAAPPASSSTALAPPPATTTSAPIDTAQRAVEAAQVAAAPSTELGVAVLDRVTGEVAVGDRGEEPFYTASLAKLVVVLDILDRRRAGLAVPDDALDLIRRALGPSDDDAMNALWTRFDGPGAAARVSAELGLLATTAPPDPSQWGQMTVSATDVVRIYAHVLDRLPPADRELVVDSLAAAPAIATDGFDQAFGLLSPEVRQEADVVAKQGWMCCFPAPDAQATRQYYLHSAAAVGAQQRFLVVLLSRIPSGPGWDPARAELTTVALAAVGALPAR